MLAKLQMYALYYAIPQKIFDAHIHKNA